MTHSADFPVPAELDGQASDAALIDRLTTLFVRRGQARRTELGQRPAERAVFRKLHATASARFEPLAGIPDDWRVGLLAGDGLDGWVRFSSDAAPTDADLGSTLGIGVKLFGIESTTPAGTPGQTADLILQDWPVFFVDDLKEMVDFTYAGTVEDDYSAYLAGHPRTRHILDSMSVTRGSVLTTTYWAILPFRLGAEVVKYRLTPTTPPLDVADDAADYLAVDAARRLLAASYTFTFEVQRRTDPDRMPLDEATVEWPEDLSPFVPVAQLHIAQQDVWARGQADYGQGLAFNIWRAPRANLPMAESSIARARRAVYAAGADLRHDANGEPLDDPRGPRVAAAPPPADTTIVQAVIHPAIGVARVGNSPDEWFLGPEVTHPQAEAPGSHRDAHGRLKRQAARFRIYGVNATGEIVRELTGDGPGSADVAITWRVELANTKAAWYGFQLALDIPEAAQAPPSLLRNATVADRTQLAITPEPRSVSGANSAVAAFDDGHFMGTPVYLGEIQTDDASRLIVLGGHGVSASHDGSLAITFANNEGWHDDVSDGPVTAEVTIDGQPIEVIGAWVVVAPPNYAPARQSVRTMWDLMRDVAIDAGHLAAPTRPSFRDDILPLFERMAGLQWVNAAFAAGFGHGGAVELTSPQALARLSDPSPAYRELRQVVANSFRAFDIDGGSPKPWPWVYGDAMNIPPVASPRQHASLTDTQHALLAQWAQGSFVPDWDPDQSSPGSIDEVPVADQGDVLTRAALDFCLADAFHPGCEMTWPVRTWTMYERPFRFLRAADDWRPPALGPELTPDAVTIPNGPLCAQRPGDITRWMAVPWQTDTASCRSGYTSDYDPYVPTFWAARVPNQVLTAENYDVVIDQSRPIEERRLAFANRPAWIEPLGAIDYTTQINNMISGFDHLGVVEARPGPTDDDFPAVMEVEDSRRDIAPAWDTDATDDAAADEARLAAGRGLTHGAAGGGRRRSATEVDISTIDKVRRFPRGLT